MSISEVLRCLTKIKEHPELIKWQDFADDNAFLPRNISKLEAEKIAFTTSTIILAIPRGESLHLELSTKIGQTLGGKYITYPYLIKTLSRLLSIGSYKDISLLLDLSLNIQSAMEAKSLSCISSLDDLL